ncbi:MAG: helix-turn-helix transcriptional regulator, partial [Kiritimatiellae bacterium]|nr:helix-turn-helix transcriptional regulator [Kiritimatiellia bacterium]
CAMFARHMGQSPISYLNSYRLAVAARMLRESSAPVADVAYSCGFAHQSYFAQQFRAAYGRTPREWRRHARTRD